MVRTTSGIECLGKTRGRTRWIREEDAYGPKRINCYKILEGKTVGEVLAVAWKEPDGEDYVR